MQTFLPYPDFQRSAAVLDKKRCWKQVVETKQIINVKDHDKFLFIGTEGGNLDIELNLENPI